MTCTSRMKEGEIAHRTRSKFPLTDTPLSDIESRSTNTLALVAAVPTLVSHTDSFQPPDAEDPPTPLELDEDDLEWHQWLSDLMNPPGE